MLIAGRHLRPRVCGESGFTLTELLVAMSVLSVLVALFSTVVSSAIHHDSEIRDESTLQTEARAALDTLTSDLRQAYLSDTATSAIQSMSGTSITFYSPDRAQPFHMRRISYRLNGTVLERATATSTDTDGDPWVGLTTLGPWQTQVGSLKAGQTVFTYENASTPPATATTTDQVKTVNVTLIIKPKAGYGKEISYSTSVTLRAGTAQ